MLVYGRNVVNEILNGKKGITIEMAGNIERLTGISSSFIIAIENRRKMEEWSWKHQDDHLWQNLYHIGRLSASVSVSD